MMGSTIRFSAGSSPAKFNDAATRKICVAIATAARMPARVYLDSRPRKIGGKSVTSIRLPVAFEKFR